LTAAITSTVASALPAPTAAIASATSAALPATSLFARALSSATLTLAAIGLAAKFFLKFSNGFDLEIEQFKFLLYGGDAQQGQATDAKSAPVTALPSAALALTSAFSGALFALAATLLVTSFTIGSSFATPLSLCASLGISRSVSVLAKRRAGQNRNRANKQNSRYDSFHHSAPLELGAIRRHWRQFSRASPATAFGGPRFFAADPAVPICVKFQ